MDVHSVQRNMESDYCHGKGMKYSESLRRLAYTTEFSVPAIGQKSCITQLPILQKHHGLSDGVIYLHPTEYLKLRHSDHLSFSKSMSDLGAGTLGNPKSTVFDRLYIGTRSNARQNKRQASGSFEWAGDIAFKNSDSLDAVELYSKAIKQAPAGFPNLFAHEKRCVCNAELGRFREALADAEYIAKNCEPGKQSVALMRVKALKDYMKRMNNFDAGYHQATSTLICLLRPREHRQLVASIPSTYGRPASVPSIGKGLSGVASTGALMNWDTDGDGSIDLDEFRRGVAALGYDAAKKEKKLFQTSRMSK